MKNIFILLIFMISYNANSKSLHIFDIDTTDFPTMRAKFWAFDEERKQITNLSTSDFELTENGEIRTITNITCPPPSPPKALSSVLVFDVSGSMGGGNLEKAKSAAREWINALPKESECAITSFNSSNYLIQDYTKDKNKLLLEVDKLTSGGGTNYDAALLDPKAGGLQICKNGKYQKVIVFLTDGNSNSTNVNEIVSEAKNQNCIIYSVTLEMPAPNEVKKIAEKTGGEWFENITSFEEADNVYRKILTSALNLEFCYLSWKSEIPCEIGIKEVKLTLLQNGNNSKISYSLLSSNLAKLEYEPFNFRFKDPKIGVITSEQIKFTARNSNFNVSDISISNPNFSISPKSFSLIEDESIYLTLSYTAQDSGYSYCKFNIINDICEQNYFSSGSYKSIKAKTPTLKLTYPNGGEEFVVGSDSIITWEGIPPSDTVGLEYSINNGSSWELITNEAYGLKYEWKKIPKPQSHKCLIKVSQREYDLGVNDGNSIPFINWQKNFGGSDADEATSIISTSDGNLVLVGQTNSNNKDVALNKGRSDIWIVKIDPNDGSIIWQKTFGGSGFDYGKSIIETKDGSYVFAGSTESNDGDITENKGFNDVWIVKLSPNDGSIIWQKTFGGSGRDVSKSIIEISDGTLVMVGDTESNDGDISDYKGNRDIWLVKMDQNNGSIIWQKTFGGSKFDLSNSIIETKDRSIVIAGLSESKDFDVVGGSGDSGFWVVKLNPNDGTILWQRTLNGHGKAEANSIIELRDNSLVVVGNTLTIKISPDILISRLNSNNGSIVWQKTFGGSSGEYALSVIQATDNSIVVIGQTQSSDGDVIGHKEYVGMSEVDYWIIKVNYIDASLIWQRVLGGNGIDVGNDILEEKEGTYFAVGRSGSTTGDITNFKGNGDIWLVKLSEPTILQSDVSDNVFSIVEPIAQAIDIDMGSLLVNDIKDSVVSGFVSNIGTYPFTVDSIYFQGADADAFSLVSGIPEYNVEPSTSHFGEFRFSPNRVGLHTAEVVIITQSDTLTQSIIGLGVEQNLAILENIIDFGQVNLGEFKDTIQTLTIKNIGTVPFTITETKHTYPNDIDFTTLAGGGNFTLQPDDSRPMKLRFTPSDDGRTSGMLEFHYNGVGSPALIQLFGEGIEQSPASLKLETIQLEAYAGQEIEIPILITEQENLLAKGIKTISTELIFNPTLLLPLDYAVEMIDNTTAKIYIDDLQISSETIQTLKTIKCKVGLGNAEECELILGNSVVNEGDADITIVNGNFKLLGICYEGGTRLINPNSNISIKTLAPNPAQNKLEIYLSLIEKGRTELSIYNISGEKVNEILNDEVNSTGDKIYNVNISSLPSGNYFVVLITPTYTEKKNFIIQR